MRRRIEEKGPPELGYHLLLGPIFTEMAGNVAQNLMDERIAPTEVVCAMT